VSACVKLKNIVMNSQNFSGKTALIIGGSSGMGKATARLLVDGGATVIIASKSKKSIDGALKDLPLANVTGVQLDLASTASVDAFTGAIGNRAIDYLVNAAGFFAPKPFLDTTAAEYDAYLDMNRGFYFITQAIAKKMKANGGGAIVNIGSYWADHAVKGTPTSAYSMAKAALQAFTLHAAMELAADNIRVNAIAPGIVETGVLDELAGSPEKAKEIFGTLQGIHPLGRNGKAAEIAATIAFLLSPDAAFITGAILPVDGGMSAGRS
jgi:NAD(P)-dependent dehydrogenase (short-subunit alcohol dehydrogenase family)